MYNFIRKHGRRVGAAGLGVVLAAGLPAAELREMSTDRPDQTESPYTVNAGHWQVEADLVSATFDESAGERTQTWSIAPLNLKRGLTDRIDLQLMLEPRIESRVKNLATGATRRVAGFGDVTTRLKINFWGNDGGKTAFGVMPFVKWPLSASALRNGRTEGGIIFPLAVELPAGWGLGAMTEVDFVSDGAGGRDTEWVNTVTLGRDLTARWGGYLEVVSVMSDAPGFARQGQFDVGFTYAPTANLQWDFGCNFGLTSSAPDYQPFAGISRRF